MWEASIPCRGKGENIAARISSPGRHASLR
jgi:hypothetical protein